MVSTLTPAEVGHGDHVCAAFDTAAEQLAAMKGFVSGGLGANDHVLYLADLTDPEAMAARLQQSGVPVAPALSSGQLVIRAATESYLESLPFDPAGMVGALHRAVDLALADGYAGLRVSGEMSWATRGMPGGERLLEYEAAVGEVFRTRPAAAPCQYDRTLFSAETLESALERHTHALLVDPDRDVPAPAMTIEFLPGGVGLVLDGIFDMSSLTALSEAVDELVGQEGVVDLRFRDLKFIDVGSLRQLMRLNRSPRRLVMHDPPEILTRVLALTWPGGVEVRRS